MGFELLDHSTWNTCPGSESSNDNNWKIIIETQYSISSQKENWTVHNQSSIYIYIYMYMRRLSCNLFSGVFKGNLLASYLDWAHSDQMVLEIVRWGGWALWMLAKIKSRVAIRPSSPLRSDGSCDGQAGRLEQVSSGLKTLKSELISRRITRLNSTQVRLFL